ncbi:uncharacterized protein LOC120279523 [Dioscorea cayenensis subsp. rotundata]|uniref:Uncharacterized protein LOC120279523 n=1 Tax=Dioscorea cayennensis subsp. rotundata TaxID=55577 RepID=A0AB40CUX2_DIOCR|nr:uncharacterized protein LOC120279523 [Dioscorea cayenensis subsp. rotundata]
MELLQMIPIMLVRVLFLVEGSLVFSGDLKLAIHFQAKMKWVSFEEDLRLLLIRGRSFFRNSNKYNNKIHSYQQGHSNLLGAPILPGASHKQFTAQQQNSLLQQVISSKEAQLIDNVAVNPSSNAED